jgi:hypothetical protein
MKPLLFVLLLGCATAIGAAERIALEPEQQARWEKVAPGVPLTPELFSVMKDIVFRMELPVEERMAAISRMTGTTELSPDQYLKRRICVWDLHGKNGPIFAAALEQRERALEFGIDLQMAPYTNENVMVEELKSGSCDAALLSGMRARTFNRYTGTIDAIGALPTQEHLRTVLEAISHPSQAGYMVEDNFVVLGIFPAGTAYVFVNDRNIRSLASAAGKRVAVLEHDTMQSRMVASIGATPVPSTFVSAPSRFNNGTVDVLAAPLVAYRTLELYKGMSPDGGIVRIPLAQITMQLIGRLDKFPPAVAQLVREAAMARYDEVLGFIREETDKVPEKWWIEVPDQERVTYESMMQNARLALREQDYYHPDMLALERKVRCKFDPDRAECANPVE